MKKCYEVMTKKPVCCLPTDVAAKAAQLMKRNNIGSIPVIKNKKSHALVGIVTDRDLALKVVAKGRNAKSTKLEAVMTRRVVTCRAQEDLQKAMNAMSFPSWTTNTESWELSPRRMWRRAAIGRKKPARCLRKFRNPAGSKRRYFRHSHEG
jgi:predicted transcriptional regulator